MGINKIIWQILNQKKIRLKKRGKNKQTNYFQALEMKNLCRVYFKAARKFKEHKFNKDNYQLNLKFNNKNQLNSIYQIWILITN